MAIAHSDHIGKYQTDGYAYQSTDLSNDYLVRNGKADEWANAYAARMQQHLNARETSFSLLMLIMVATSPASQGFRMHSWHMQ